MTFGEKLFKLRKEKGLSQEALAEKVNTTRQAISKWENGQGFPETEKLLMIGNIFEVSIDYLLKDSAEPRPDNKEGYYVSREMAEGFLLHQRKVFKYVSFGLSMLIFSTVPYLVFKQEPAIYTLLIIIIAVLGIGAIVTGMITEEDKYKVLKKEALIFDQNHHKELTARYKDIKRRYAAIMVVGVCSIVAGVIPFLLERKHIASGLIAYYPVCVVLITVGVYILIRTLPIIEAYQIMVNNEEYINRFGFKLSKKVRKRMDNI
ncbi:XRE family transcriptional regulator [Bacillus subtilis]|uniref:helix-turn-helix domain-containing protein n=1 Tax=Bacillus subtilis TaxID=1423 RepID=UPI00102E32B1|nr:helix-turn-helix transcriptional regulator [Bacillus subtilis]TAH79418.1 XRE family transcriptional regulator [Bacillus subtilis]TAH86500.1 XRE family transcriptional regulator [Bacillus subtilis]